MILGVDYLGLDMDVKPRVVMIEIDDAHDVGLDSRAGERSTLL